MAENTVPAPPSPASSLNHLLDRLLTEAEAAPPASAPLSPSPPPTGDTASGDTASGDTASGDTASGGTDESPAPHPLGLLAQNPALLSAIPTLMENLSPLLAGLKTGVGSAPNATRPHSIDRHTALLCALKPYLSPERQTAADTVIRLCRMWDALERSGISLSGLFGSLSAETGAPHEGR